MTSPTVWTRTLVITASSTVIAALAGLGLCSAWFIDANNSDSSTAAIGIVFSFVAAIPMALGLILAVAALIAGSRSPRVARGLAVTSAVIVGGFVFLVAAVWVPSA